MAKVVALCLLISDYIDSNDYYYCDLGPGFFTVVKIVVSLFSLCALYDYYKRNKNFGVWVFGMIAVLYNPVCDVEFLEGTWVVLDIFAASAFAISLLLEFREKAAIE